jgi:para-nitrobenzyl esterase
MTKPICVLLFFALSFCAVSQAQDNTSGCRVTTREGVLEGTRTDGICTYKGVPFAQPPVGALRWQAPQPPKPWQGVRSAKKFGPRPMQTRVYSDMVFRSDTISEDCLYLNVWTAGPSDTARPVLVYFYGGGFRAGSGDEPRYDGASMARKGIVAVTVNYRLGVFGFLALPELTRESPHHASGNYGLMDQQAALQWVHDNIAAFGGDPNRVTIAGQSAGSMSVSAQMAAPRSKGLFAGAIGESGSALGNLSPRSLSASEQQGEAFLALSGAHNLAGLRQLSADALLKLSAQPDAPHFGPNIDGYFFTEPPMETFATGKQADVPLLAGWTSAEVNYRSLLGDQTPTVAHYTETLHKLYGDKATEALKLYPAKTEEEVKASATALASDRFIAYATWKWIDLHGKTDGFPVYRYLYAHLLPPLKGQTGSPSHALGAPHSSEIPYALGNLPLVHAYDWTAEDYQVSRTLQGYFVHFIKTGNPNGTGLPTWYGLQASIPKVMVIDAQSGSRPEQHQKRYLFLDQFYYH